MVVDYTTQDATLKLIGVFSGSCFVNQSESGYRIINYPNANSDCDIELRSYPEDLICIESCAVRLYHIKISRYHKQVQSPTFMPGR